ncbi:hypothetical protein C8R45DRAFT_1070329 [Mycena sanguinolenta]|nr:hypothetical protein C8R45DRAFT_1070329 [Mycena sanguinolenta]
MDPAHNSLDMSLFERGGALDAPYLRLPPYTKASSYSPPIFPTDIHATGLPSRHGYSHSDSGLGFQSSQWEDEYERFPQSAAATNDFRDDFFVAANNSYLPNPCSNTNQFAYSSYCNSPASSETTSSGSCNAEMFNTQSTPDTARPQDFGHTVPLFPQCNAQFGPQIHPTSGSQSLPRPPNHWGYPSSTVPSISHNSRCSISAPSSPPTWHSGLGGTFGQFPVAEDVHRWPQLFKINQVKKVGVKKQVLACLFCRERKIACFRPPADHPDQTCNQCARRKRTCKYPTESRRGQHTRNRHNAKKFLGYEETNGNVTAPASPSEDP